MKKLTLIIAYTLILGVGLGYGFLKSESWSLLNWDNKTLFAVASWYMIAMTMTYIWHLICKDEKQYKQAKDLFNETD